MSLLRQGRTLHPEDLIFLVRYDRAKVNRLRTYLSWKDIRKNAKDESSNPAAAGPGEIDLAVDESAGAAAGGGPGAPPPSMSRKLKVKLPWEYSTIFADYVIPSETAAGGEEELDEDDQEALMESRLRLREADRATLRMTREQYEHYSECRAASFTFKKGKKFREFISSSTYLDHKPNDDIVDILGFLAFEVVREITLGAREAWIKEYGMMISREEERERKVKESQAQKGLETEEGQGSKSSEKDTHKVQEVRVQSPAVPTTTTTTTRKRKRSSSSSTPVSPPSTDPTPPPPPPPTSYLDAHKQYTSTIQVTDDEPLADGKAFCGLFSISDEHKKRDEEAAKVEEERRRERLERLQARELEREQKRKRREKEKAEREEEEERRKNKGEGDGAEKDKTDEGKAKDVVQGAEKEKTDEGKAKDVVQDTEKEKTDECKAKDVVEGTEQGGKDAGKAAGMDTAAEQQEDGDNSGNQDKEMADEPQKDAEANARDAASSEVKEAEAGAGATAANEKAETIESHVDATTDDSGKGKDAGSETEDKANSKGNSATAADDHNEDDPTAKSEANTGYKEITPLLFPHHIREAFARLQREKTRPALSSGSRDVGSGTFATGGLRRTRMWVI